MEEALIELELAFRILVILGLATLFAFVIWLIVKVEKLKK